MSMTSKTKHNAEVTRLKARVAELEALLRRADVELDDVYCSNCDHYNNRNPDLEEDIAIFLSNRP